MELTLNNLLDFLSHELHLKRNKINESYNISDFIDGYSAEDMLIELGDKFNVSFENFDFMRCFHSEIEIMRGFTLCNLLRLTRIRKIEPLTVGDLYEYMKNNPKQAMPPNQQ